MSLELKYDGIGISAKVNQIYNHEDNWKAVYSIRKAENVIYMSSAEEINLIHCATIKIMKKIEMIHHSVHTSCPCIKMMF